MSAFLALSALLLAMAAVSLMSMRSLTQRQTSILAHETEQMTKATELGRLHQMRVSAIRAFLITKDRSYLKTERQAGRDFSGIVNSLSSDSVPGATVVLQHLRSYESDYSSYVERAIREPSRATWILETLVRPRRLDLERAISDLIQISRARWDASNTEFQQKAFASIRTIIAVTIGQVLILIGLGYLLVGTVREEQSTLVRSQQAQDSLQRTEQRAALLAETGKLLTESPDPANTLPRVAELAVQWLSNICIIELTEGSGLLRPAALAIAKTDREVLFRSLHRDLPQGLGSLFSTSQILQSGRPTLVPIAREAKLQSLGIQSFMAVHLRARQRMLGIILLIRTDRADPYDESSFQFVQELSHQIALAMDNARLRQQAEQGLRMREELLSVVAHDLKNPLTSIRMNSELMLRDQPEEESLVSKTAGTIRDSSAGMEQLIHDLLDLTKIESGRIVLDLRPHDADDLVSAAMRMLAPQAEARKIELIKEVRRGECVAECDSNRVIQVLSNLLGNAIKFTGKGGRVRIEAQATGEGIRFSVIDNGPGIPSDALPHVFDRYWQARREKADGAGLGLSIARGIVEAHGGRIWVESALHIGSRFFFTLPEARKQVRPKAA